MVSVLGVMLNPLCCFVVDAHTCTFCLLYAVLQDSRYQYYVTQQCINSTATLISLHESTTGSTSTSVFFLYDIP